MFLALIYDMVALRRLTFCSFLAQKSAATCLSWLTISPSTWLFFQLTIIEKAWFTWCWTTKLIDYVCAATLITSESILFSIVGMVPATKVVVILTDIHLIYISFLFSCVQGC